ncbi:hypothetical protein IJM86_05850 [bacterium]|nr:hypothetical protein [bacterium]
MELITWVNEIMKGNIGIAKTPQFLLENEKVKKIIYRWHNNEKQAFINYLQNLI